jgi:hypothetical protein
MERLTYKVYNTRFVIIDGHKVICDDKVVKKLLEYILKNAPRHGPEMGFNPCLFEVFGKNIKLIDDPNDRSDPEIEY